MMRENSVANRIVAFLNESPGRNNKEIAQGIKVDQDSVRYALYHLKRKGYIFGSNKVGWMTDEDLKGQIQRKKEIAENVLEECYSLFENSQSEKNKIQLARIIVYLLKKY